MRLCTWEGFLGFFAAMDSGVSCLAVDVERTTPVSLHLVGRGSYAAVYRECGAARVYAVTDEAGHGKEVAAEAAARLPGNPHVPAVQWVSGAKPAELAGSLPPWPERLAVWSMPLYAAPLRRADAPFAWLAFEALSRCLDDVEAELKEDSPELLNYCVVRLARQRGVHAPIVEALDIMSRVASDLSEEYIFEFARRNVASDDAGNLVLLDVLYDRVTFKRLCKEWRGMPGKARARRCRMTDDFVERAVNGRVVRGRSP
jgi:hypothetical protein